MNNKGYTTVFFTLIISTLLLFTFTALEAVRIHTGRVKMLSCVHSMRSSILADYNSALFARYHLLFMDPTYGTGSEAAVEEKAEDYLDASLNGEKGDSIYTFVIQDIAVVDEKNILWEDMRQVKEQVAEYEKAAGVLNRIRKLTEKLKEKGNDISSAAGETERNGVEISVSDDSAGAEEKTETGTASSDGAPETEDPRKSLGDALKFGTLAFVMPDCSVSKEKHDFSNAPSAKYENEKEKEHDRKFQDIGILKSFLKDSAKDQNGNKLAQNAAFADYVSNCFSHGINPNPDSVMSCEIEYILKGKNNDYDNLQAVVDELIWFRMPGNYACLLTDSEKKSEALTVAAGICTAVGSPEMIEIVKYLILGCWAYGETLSEMKTLLAGGKIPYVKTKENWSTDLKHLAASQQSKKEERGLSYEEYLMILLAGKSGKALNAAYARMLDIMELNIRKEYPDFDITNCIGSMTIQGKICQNPFFARGGKKENYEYYFEEELRY